MTQQKELKKKCFAKMTSRELRKEGFTVSEIFVYTHLKRLHREIKEDIRKNTGDEATSIQFTTSTRQLAPHCLVSYGSVNNALKRLTERELISVTLSATGTTIEMYDEK